MAAKSEADVTFEFSEKLGINIDTANDLYDRFQTWEALKRASLAEIEAAGLSHETALLVFQRLGGVVPAPTYVTAGDGEVSTVLKVPPQPGTYYRPIAEVVPYKAPFRLNARYGISIKYRNLLLLTSFFPMMMVLTIILPIMLITPMLFLESIEMLALGCLNMVIFGSVIIAIYILYITKFVHNYTYEFSDEYLIVRRGVWWKQQTMIPYGRIQNINVYSPFFMRLLGISTLQIETAGTILSDGNIPGIEYPDPLIDFIMAKVEEVKKKKAPFLTRRQQGFADMLNDLQAISRSLSGM